MQHHRKNRVYKYDKKQEEILEEQFQILSADERQEWADSMLSRMTYLLSVNKLSLTKAYLRIIVEKCYKYESSFEPNAVDWPQKNYDIELCFRKCWVDNENLRVNERMAFLKILKNNDFFEDEIQEDFVTVSGRHVQGGDDEEGLSQKGIFQSIKQFFICGSNTSSHKKNGLSSSNLKKMNSFESFNSQSSPYEKPNQHQKKMTHHMKK